MTFGIHLMAKKTPPHESYPQWTEARFNQFIRSAIRAAWNKWPPKWNVLNKAKRIVTGQRHKYEYQCNSCNQWFKQKEVEIDHINSAGSSYDWNVFIRNLFVGENELQVLCKGCHKEKTKRERNK